METLTATAAASENIHVRVLLVSNHQNDIHQVRTQLRKTMGFACTVLHCGSMEEAANLFRCNLPEVDLALLDMGLVAGDRPQDTFSQMQNIVGDVPIIIFTERNDHAVALAIMKLGASDNVTKGEFSSDPFKLRDAIEFALIRRKIASTVERKNANEMTRLAEKNAASLREAENLGQEGLQKAKGEATSALKDLRESAALLVERDHTISWLSGGYSVENIKVVHKNNDQ